MADINEYIERKRNDKTLKVGVGKKLTLGGETRLYQTYSIPIEYLYYNDLNGRIAVYEQEYAANPGNVPLAELKETDIKTYNEIIGKFIKDSATDNGKSYNKTKEDIRANLQKVPGVVLSDGRIIDGNRRFTALRELYRDTGNQSYSTFECVVLPAPAEDNKEDWKQIISLEINLQFNEDEKRDYDPIDKLVSFYTNCINPDTKVFTKKEYVHTSGISDGDYDNMERQVAIMVDYLEWRGQPGAFYLLKNEKLDGPIVEIAGKTHKDFQSFLGGDVKNDIYTYLTLVPQGEADRTRHVRSLMTSANNSGALYDTYRSYLTSDPETNILLGKALSEKDVKHDDDPEADKEKRKTMSLALEKIKEAYAEGDLKEKSEKQASEPVKALDRAIDLLDTIKLSEVNKSPEPRKRKFLDELDKLKAKIAMIENGIGKDS